jgi:signal peptidase I
VNNSEELLFFETSGFSMWPFLKTKEKVVVKKVSPDNLKIGDIILYRLDNQMVCHRLVRKVACGSGYLLYARGDASTNLAEPITEKALAGKVIGILRNGRVINFTGIWCRFVNRLIVELAFCIRTGIKIIKRPVICARSVVRRLLNH